MNLKPHLIWFGKTVLGAVLTIGSAVLALMLTSQLEPFLALPKEVAKVSSGIAGVEERVEGLDTTMEQMNARLEAIDKIHLRLMGGFETAFAGVLSDEDAARFDLSREDVIVVSSRRNSLLRDEGQLGSSAAGRRPVTIDDYILVRNVANNMTVFVVQRVKSLNRSSLDLAKDIDFWMTRHAAERLGVRNQGHRVEVRLILPEEVPMIRMATVIDDAPSAAAEPAN